MIIVQLSGGLGNQMFQYALYRTLQQMGKEVKLDDRTCYLETGTRNKQLDAFSLTYDAATKQEIITMTDASMNPMRRLRRKIWGRRDLSYREASFRYDPNVFMKDPVYLEGCFQTEQYFENYKEIICKDFSLRDEVVTDTVKRYLEQIETTESVGVHIRRGDYLSEKFKAVYENICTVEYYEKAIAHLKEHHPQSKFYLFTNDIEWVTEHMGGEEFEIVQCAQEETGYLDLFLMSHCKHQIIANSSFSWWAAWLNRNPEKIVIAPSKWMNGKDCSDIYTEGMLVF